MVSDSNAPASSQRSVSMGYANLVGPLLGAAATLVLLAFHATVRGLDAIRPAFLAFCEPVWSFFIVLLCAIVVHEAIQALGWGLFGRLRPDDFKFGVQWSTLTPYAHCRVPLRASVYRAGTLAPAFVLGVAPALIGTLLNLPWSAALGWFMTLIAGGDLLVIHLLRGVPGSQLVSDHPTEAGCVVHG